MKVVLKNEGIHFLAILALVVLFIPIAGPVSVVIGFFFGFFIDLDHLFDYGFYLIEKRKKFSPRQFISGNYFTKCPFFTPLHSWELCLTLLIIYLSTSNLHVLLAFLSLTTHLFIDQFTNSIVPLHGFLIYRLYLRKKEVQYK